MDYKKAGVDIEAGYERACEENNASRGSWRTWRIFRSIFTC